MPAYNVPAVRSAYLATEAQKIRHGFQFLSDVGLSFFFFFFFFFFIFLEKMQAAK